MLLFAFLSHDAFSHQNKKAKRILSSFILTINMSSSKEHVFVIRVSEDIGNGIIRGLIQKGVDTAAYVRNEQKARDLFKE